MHFVLHEFRRKNCMAGEFIKRNIYMNMYPQNSVRDYKVCFDKIDDKQCQFGSLNFNQVHDLKGAWAVHQIHLQYLVS
jgi:hypothetical protein